MLRTLENMIHFFSYTIRQSMIHQPVLHEFPLPNLVLFFLEDVLLLLQAFLSPHLYLSSTELPLSHSLFSLWLLLLFWLKAWNSSAPFFFITTQTWLLCLQQTNRVFACLMCVCLTNWLVGVVIHQSVLWNCKKATSCLTSVWCRRVCLVLCESPCVSFCKKCEADFVFVVVNISSNVLFLECEVWKNVKDFWF